MAETGKKVEVRYGPFSCTIEGFDDPLGQMREVLALMQRMIVETPALADADAGLDDAQFARLDQALADRRAEAGDADERGVIIIRSGARIAGDAEDAEDAEIVAESANRDGGGQAARQHRPGDAPASEPGLHPSAAVFSAPAAAVAEAAYAASMAADGAHATGGAPAEEPLGHEEPGEPATPAALYAAPAADVAEVASHGDGGDTAPGAAPADADDDGEDAGLDRADEAAGERVQRDASARRSDGGGSRDGVDPRGSYGYGADPDRGEAGRSQERPEPDGEAPGDPWQAPSRHKAVASQGFIAERETLPRVNIFARAPAEAGRAEPVDEHAEDLAPAAPEPLGSPRREPGAVAEPGPRGPLRGVHEADEPDELPDEERADGTGDRRDRSGDVEADTTENRLAALITRYQSGVLTEQDDGGRHADTGGISAGDLAERAQAMEVADLLAVSAAWLTLAGGRPQFSRREVMEVFETLPGDHPRTLEARIKGFGKLVRSGTLVLVDDGAFAMPPRERERFRALMDQG